MLVPAVAAAPAGAKTKRVCKTSKVHGHKKKRCHRVKVKPKPVAYPTAATVVLKVALSLGKPTTGSLPSG